MNALLPTGGLLLAVLLTALVLAMMTLLLFTRRARTHRRRPLTGAEGLVGEVGEVVSPGAKVFVHGEYWNARVPPSLPRGARIRVVKVIGEGLEVEEARRETGEW
jgi:membrane-bound serine protease (ClpP class)